MSQALEVRQLALDEFDQRYAALRLQATSEARQAMIQSLRRYGQISPLVVWPSAGAWVLIDGFKRVEAARQVPELLTLDARLIEADPRTAKAAIYGLNRLSRRVHLLEEAWIVCALVREDCLTQWEAAQLLGHDKSWISRRLALVEKLCPAAKDELSLGLLSPYDGPPIGAVARGQPGRAGGRHPARRSLGGGSTASRGPAGRQHDA
jgi:ParB-like chromosome segregation protein Spo0J